MEKVNFTARPGGASQFGTLLTQLGKKPAAKPNFKGTPGGATQFGTLLTQLRSDDRELVAV